MNLYLTRYESTQDGTFGKLIAGDLILHTIERPWLNNKPFESCIPPGEYIVDPYTRPNGDEVYILTNPEKKITRFQEPDSKRYTILIHAGNYVKDIVGCIAPGTERWGDMVTHSKDAMILLREKLGKKEHFLFIDFDEVN